MSFAVTVRNVHGRTTAVGAGGSHTLVVDRPEEAGGGGLGFNGGQLLHLAVAGCISNDLFREAAARGITLTRVVVHADGGYGGEPAVSTGVTYSVEVEGSGSEDELRALVAHVDDIGEIPNSLRRGTDVALESVVVRGLDYVKRAGPQH